MIYTVILSNRCVHGNSMQVNCSTVADYRTL